MSKVQVTVRVKVDLAEMIYAVAAVISAVAYLLTLP